MTDKIKITLKKDIDNAIVSGNFAQIIERYDIFKLFDPEIMPLVHYFDLVEFITLGSYSGLDQSILNSIDPDSLEFLKTSHPKKDHLEFIRLFNGDKTEMIRELIIKLENSVSDDEIEKTFGYIMSLFESKIEFEQSEIQYIHDSINKCLLYLIRINNIQITTNYTSWDINILKQYTFFKYISKDYGDIFEALDKFNLLEIKQNQTFCQDFNKFILGINLVNDKYNCYPYLAKVIHSFSVKNKINDGHNLTKQFLDEEFVIIPCNLDKTPARKFWNKVTSVVSKELYSHKKIVPYTKPNIMNLNKGLICGKLSGVIVIDIDLKDEGLSYWTDLTNKNHQIETLTVETGSGGMHYYFKFEEYMNPWYSMNKLWGKGIDFRTDNGYVIVPPSIHPNGNKYKFMSDISTGIRNQIKSLPEWLKTELVTWFTNRRKREPTLFKFRDIYKTPENCLEFCKLRIRNLYFVPNIIKTIEFYKELITHHKNIKDLILYLPPKKELFDFACSINKDNLKYVPKCFL